MLQLTKFLENPEGRIIMSIILGFGLASLFKMSCSGKNCIVYNTALDDNIENNIYGYNDDCYKYSRKQVTCNSDKKTVNTFVS